MKRRLTFFLLSLFISSILYAQDGTGKVKVYKDPVIDTLLQMHISKNRQDMANPNDDGLSGYRIQIFFDSGNESRENADQVIEEFTEEYPGIRTYLTFREPYYRVRVGDFRKKIEALGFLQQIKDDYPNAWVIKDQINFPELYEKPQKPIENDQENSHSN